MHYLDIALNAQRFSLVTPAEVNIDLSLFRAGNSSLGEVFLRLASKISFLVDSDSAVAVFTLVNDSSKVVEISGGSTEGIEIIDSTFIRRTENVEDSLETTVVLDVFLSVEDHGADIFVVSKETTNSSVRDDVAISIDLFEGDVDTSESKGGESEDADEE